MIFIEIMSCIILTYNISSVGSIIRKITSYDEGKEKNMKTFTRMQEKSEISNELTKKMTNFIHESVDMKRKYNIQEEENLLAGLPESILEEYRKETHVKIFRNIPFFRHISNKYLQ